MNGQLQYNRGLTDPRLPRFGAGGTRYRCDAALFSRLGVVLPA